MMYKAFKYKLKPTTAQLIQLNQIGGGTRWLWNYMLNQNITQYAIDKKFIFNRQMQLLLPNLKIQYPWLQDIPSQSLQQKCADLDKAFKQMKSGKGFPKYKSKKTSNDSFRIPQTNDHIKPTKTQIQIPKLGWIKWKRHIPLQGLLKSITIKQENNNWYCVCLCELPDVKQIKIFNKNNVVGIDLGLKDLVITSTGVKYDTPKFYRSKQDKLSKLQRSASKKVKGSNNQNKIKIQIRKLHNKIKNQRSDYLHKISHQITNDYLFIGVENLNIKGMSKNHKLSKSILDQGWGILLYQLDYKSKRNGGLTIKINRYAPSSKTCSSCGNIQDMPLNIREYNCPNCGLHIDRDINASYNIKKWAIDELIKNGYGTDPCGGASDGDISNDISYVSLKQEKILDVCGNGPSIDSGQGNLVL